MKINKLKEEIERDLKIQKSHYIEFKCMGNEKMADFCEGKIQAYEKILELIKE